MVVMSYCNYLTDLVYEAQLLKLKLDKIDIITEVDNSILPIKLKI